MPLPRPTPWPHACTALMAVPRAFLLSVLLVVLLPLPAQAALGGTLDAVVAADVQVRTAQRVAVHSRHQVHERVLDTGTVVREYADATGRVFAVSWRGPLQPDLRALLGEHFARLQAAASAPRRDHRALLLREAGLVIESTGRMRALAGRAWLPALLPAGVALEDVQ